MSVTDDSFEFRRRYEMDREGCADIGGLHVDLVLYRGAPVVPDPAAFETLHRGNNKFYIGFFSDKTFFMTLENEFDSIITSNNESEKNQILKIILFCILFSALILQLYIFIKAILWRYILILTV
jgi:hypothetical protein